MLAAFGPPLQRNRDRFAARGGRGSFAGARGGRGTFRGGRGGGARSFDERGGDRSFKPSSFRGGRGERGPDRDFVPRSHRGGSYGPKRFAKDELVVDCQ